MGFPTKKKLVTMEMKMRVLGQMDIEQLPGGFSQWFPLMLVQAVASSLCDGDGGGDDDQGVEGDGGGEDDHGVDGDDDDTNLWVHLCIMGMASTSDSFVFIFFGGQHIRNPTHKTAQHTTKSTTHNTHNLQ